MRVLVEERIMKSVQRRVEESREEEEGTHAL